MDNEYGEMNGRVAEGGRQLGKAGGAYSIDGVLYMSVRHGSVTSTPTMAGRQDADHASVIKIQRPWSALDAPMQEKNLQRPMFPGMRFATRFLFITAKICSCDGGTMTVAMSIATSTTGFG